MNTSMYIELAVRGAGISLATYALIGQVFKPGLRMLAKRKAKSGRLTSRQEEYYRWLTRTMCIVVGGLLGMLPLWPAWFVQAWWGVLLGAIGGSMAPAIHHAVAKALPDRIRRVISGGSVKPK